MEAVVVAEESAGMYRAPLDDTEFPSDLNSRSHPVFLNLREIQYKCNILFDFIMNRAELFERSNLESLDFFRCHVEEL